MSDSSSSTPKKAAVVRTCAGCRIRMSSYDLDSHTVCTNCRGKVCNYSDRCETCTEWPDEKMNAYLKHRSSLERKRLSKKRIKEAKDFDFATVCTGVQGSEGVLSDEGGSRDNVLEDSASSVVSASRAHIEQ